jgi:elongation factor G
MGKSFEMSQKRVFGFIGHAGAGKTSICEAILFNAKATERMGSVDAGQANMDFEPEEQKRQYSVSASFFDVDLKNNKLFLIDTPGNSNFIPEALVLLPAMGAAVIAVDALDGSKFQTEQLCERAKNIGLPLIAFINRLDKEHSDFDKALASMKDNFAIEPVVLQIPIGKEEGFNGLVDLMTKKAYTYDGKSGAGTAIDIPADLAARVDEMRSAMIERLVEGDDEIMMKYLEGEEVTNDELKSCLKKGVMKNAFCPVLVGAATKNIGIDLLVDTVVTAFPHPGEERPRSFVNPDKGEQGTLTISESGDFAAQVIKTLSDPFAGKVSILRVYQGTLSPEDQFFNINRNAKEKPGKLFYVRGKDQAPMDKAVAGDIFACIKVREIGTGDTMVGSNQVNIQFPELPRMEPMVNLAVHPKTQGEEEKMATALARILEEDANLRFWRQDQTKEFILSGVGNAQIDVAMERMKRKFNVEVEFSEPKIPYRETIKGKAEAQGKHKKQSGGRGQYVNAIVGGVVPKNFIPAIEKGVVEAMEKGDLTGNPVQDVRVELFFGSYHAVDSSEMAFKVAGSLAWKKSSAEANPIILEPIMHVDITVPSDVMGDVYGNVSSRRGKVLGSEDSGRLTTIKTEIPQAEIHTLSQDLRAMTGDRAFFVSTFDHYEEVPREAAEKITEAYRKEREAD